MGTTLKRWFRAVPVLAVAVATHLGGVGLASAGTLDTIRADQTLRIAYRDDARPFSYKESNNAEPAGYMVNLCRAVAKKLADQLGMPSLKVVYVAVTAANRFEALEKHNADLLCEPTSATLSRRKQVDFSIPTFVDGASLLTSDMNLHGLDDLRGQGAQDRRTGRHDDRGSAATHAQGARNIG